MRIVLVGAVGGTECTLMKLIEHRMNLVGVFGYQVDPPHNVSGYVLLSERAAAAGIPHYPFKRINDHVAEIRALAPDMIFVVGLSQLISDEIINIPKHGCVGFHPTLLPKGRGRAPLAWLVLNEKQGAASFFRIAQGTDDGPLYVQETFDIVEEDDATDVNNKLLDAMKTALDRWLPALKNGDMSATNQDETEATYYGRRSPEDGQIDWNQSASHIDRLIKSATHPHPGAYTFIDDRKIIIWKSSVENDESYRGVIGRILRVSDDGSPVIQCSSGLLKVHEYEVDDGSKLVVGKKLGYYWDHEINSLRREIASLRNELRELKHNS